jgi:hypothetical protein|tara:strand:+ start:290 stop:517 length:228 start_codon:yes stop_codon:yes gene_type:complete
MAQQIINVGTSVNKGDGDPLRTAFTKINDNTTESYTRIVALEDGSLGFYISLATLKTEVAASSDFADFKTRIAAL